MTTKCILLVDDEYDLQQAVRGILEDEGYDVVACSSGIEALNTLADSRPDLILLDIMMPVMSGYDVLEQLAKREAVRQVPVVLMSAVEPAGESKARSSCAFLKKPFRLEKLLATVRHYAGA